jgi:hypothetical protein
VVDDAVTVLISWNTLELTTVRIVRIDEALD